MCVFKYLDSALQKECCYLFEMLPTFNFYILNKLAAKFSYELNDVFVSYYVTILSSMKLEHVFSLIACEIQSIKRAIM